VYVAGRIRQVATLWKNGIPQNLTDGTYGAGASSVFVSGNDVYVVGSEGVSHVVEGSIAKLWKNGMAQDLSGVYGSSVFVSGSDVYIAGTSDCTAHTGYAVLWKNGEVQTLTDCDWTEACSVFVSGNDVYVAGFDRNEQENEVAVLWKNGEAQYLTDGTADWSVANSVFVVKK
jgi:hypothetical protein